MPGLGHEVNTVRAPVGMLVGTFVGHAHVRL
ncbi:MAG: hypothetical protein QOJ03_2797 [Frankiaceae bacterium]|nr:hypothetical protein [Frankiaceae bacterium]